MRLQAARLPHRTLRATHTSGTQDDRAIPAACLPQVAALAGEPAPLVAQALTMPGEPAFLAAQAGVIQAGATPADTVLVDAARAGKTRAVAAPAVAVLVDAARADTTPAVAVRAEEARVGTVPADMFLAAAALAERERSAPTSHVALRSSPARPAAVLMLFRANLAEAERMSKVRAVAERIAELAARAPELQTLRTVQPAAPTQTLAEAAWEWADRTALRPDVLHARLLPV